MVRLGVLSLTQIRPILQILPRPNIQNSCSVEDLFAKKSSPPSGVYFDSSSKKIAMQLFLMVSIKRVPCP